MLMSEAEVAVFIGICPRSVRNFTHRGLLPVIRLGRRRLFRRDAVLAALRTLEEENTWATPRDVTVETVQKSEPAAARIARAKYQRLRAVLRNR